MRIRITFTKTGALRYIGHLDLHKLWERASRRANLALLYSQGFHPQPKIQLASALPLGFASSCELVDLWIDGDADLNSLSASLTKVVPPGLGIIKVEKVEDNSPPMQTQVVSAVYKVTILNDMIDETWLTNQINACLQAHTLPRERRGKAYDLRPLIESIEFRSQEKEGEKSLTLQLAAREGATGRPEEVLDSLEIAFEDTRIERFQLLFK